MNKTVWSYLFASKIQKWKKKEKKINLNCISDRSATSSSSYRHMLWQSHPPPVVVARTYSKHKLTKWIPIGIRCAAATVVATHFPQPTIMSWLYHGARYVFGGLVFTVHLSWHLIFVWITHRGGLQYALFRFLQASQRQIYKKKKNLPFCFSGLMCSVTAVPPEHNIK